MKSFAKTKLILLPGWMVCALLLSPFLLFCFHLEPPALPELSVFFKVTLATSFQAAVSAVGSLVLALLSLRGLSHLSQKKYYPLLEGLFLLPCLMPPLLLVLSLAQLADLFASFPFGLPALIFSQVISYMGFCAIVLNRRLRQEAQALSEWAYLHQCSPWLFLNTLSRTVLAKELKILFAFVFVSCWTSLSLPLLTSGSSMFSMEFLIYEKLKDPATQGQALSLIGFQSLWVFFICFKLFYKSSFSTLGSQQRGEIKLLPKASFSCIPLLALFVSVGGLFLVTEKEAFFQLIPLWPLVLSATLNSLITGLACATLTLLLLTVVAFSFPNLKARSFIACFAPPGVGSMGLALLLVPLYDRAFVLMKWSVGLCLLSFPSIFRFQGESALRSLKAQVETARLFGASWGLIFSKIIMPGGRKAFFLCAGVSGFLACGDFAYSLMVSSGQDTLSLLVYDLFSSYRLDEAVLLSWLMLAVSFLVLIFYIGLGFFVPSSSLFFKNLVPLFK